jgi:hypothetical protein
MASYRLDDMKTASRQFADSEPSRCPYPAGVSVAAAGFHCGLDRFGMSLGLVPTVRPTTRPGTVVGRTVGYLTGGNSWAGYALVGEPVSGSWLTGCASTHALSALTVAASAKGMSGPNIS